MTSLKKLKKYFWYVYTGIELVTIEQNSEIL
jgi:hypothetical protein